MGSSCPSRWGQSDPLDGVNLTPSLNTEITSENTTETTPPPLPLSCPSSARSNPSKVDSQPKPEPDEPQEDEEENKNKKIKNAGEQPCQETIAQQMVDFWNQSVQSKIYAGQEVRLTEKRKELLDAFLETVLEDKFPSAKFDGWRNYCSLIAQSRFLTGDNSSGFKATLDWALIPSNAYKVLEGAIYDKPEPFCQPKDQSWEAFSEELARTLPTGQHLQPWLKISVNLAKMIGQVRYRSWFAKVLLEELGETKATFSIEGNFMRDYVTTHFLRDLRHAIQVLYPKVTQIDFQTRPLEGGAHQNRRMGLDNRKKGENECNQR